MANRAAAIITALVCLHRRADQCAGRRADSSTDGSSFRVTSRGGTNERTSGRTPAGALTGWSITGTQRE